MPSSTPNTYIQFSNPVSVATQRTLPTSFSMSSMFTDNSRVCYKPGSLSYGGVGTVRNGRSKSVRA